MTSQIPLDTATAGSLIGREISASRKCDAAALSIYRRMRRVITLSVPSTMMLLRHDNETHADNAGLANIAPLLNVADVRYYLARLRFTDKPDI